MEAYDALPYVDQEYNFPAVQTEVLRLIEEEMRSVQALRQTTICQTYRWQT